MIKIVLGLLVLGVVLFDGGSIVVNFFTLDSTARDVAIAVSTEVDRSEASSFTDDEIRRMAQRQIPEGERDRTKVARKGTEIDDQGIVHVRLKRSVDTLVVDRIGPLRNWARATANGRAST